MSLNLVKVDGADLQRSRGELGEVWGGGNYRITTDRQAGGGGGDDDDGGEFKRRIRESRLVLTG